MADGERYCLLVDAKSGVPLFHPNLFVTTQVRNPQLSTASMEAALAAINVLLTFCDQRGIDLEGRCLRRRLFTVGELDALRDECQKYFAKQDATSVVVPFRKSSQRTVSRSTQYGRLTHIAHYVQWLTTTILGAAIDAHAERLVAAIHHGILVRRPRRGKGSRLDKAKGPSAQQMELLARIVDPLSDESPFEGGDIRYRNALIIDLLLCLGIRGGELLNLRIRDIDWARNELVIARRPDEKADPRARQPKVKTLDRRIPLRDTLVQKLHTYVTTSRSKVPGARKHDYLLVTHKSGPHQGKPITISGYQKIIRTISNACSELRGFHGHLLRHAWNERFSNYMDKLEHPPSADVQEAIRSYIQGWREGSGTSATYNRRFIEHKAFETQLELQKGTIRLPRGIDK